MIIPDKLILELNLLSSESYDLYNIARRCKATKKMSKKDMKEITLHYRRVKSYFASVKNQFKDVESPFLFPENEYKK